MLLYRRYCCSGTVRAPGARGPVPENLRFFTFCTAAPSVLSPVGRGSFMISQPYVYKRHELAEPDWRRFPGWAGVSAADWESAQWQRAHCVKNTRQLKQVTGSGLDES